MSKINASIVLYHNSPTQIEKVISCFLKSKIEGKLYLVDNSANDDLKHLGDLDTRIEYIFNNANIGYGSAHNIAIRKSIEDGVPYHLVLNPDIYFEQGVLETIHTYMEQNPDVGQLMPKVLYPDGKLQYLCKLLPTPFDLFGRRFFNFGPFKKYIEKRNYTYELRFTGYTKVMNVPYLSGCFMFFRTKALQEVGLFDERFFMYMEDVDLARRMHSKYNTIFLPTISIYHEYEKASYKNIKSLKMHLKSSIQYFNKWGWFLDKERNQINTKAVQVIKKI